MSQKPEKAALPEYSKRIVNLTHGASMIFHPEFKRRTSKKGLLKNEPWTITNCLKHRKESQASSMINAPRKSMWLNVTFRTDLKFDF